MIYNFDDILFWNLINIDHIELLLNTIDDEFYKNKLTNFRDNFVNLSETPGDENFIYNNIKTHSQFINSISENKNNYPETGYSINHMINEGICGYRILLIIEQNAAPIPIIENIRIQEMLLPSSIEHLRLIIKSVSDQNLLKQMNSYLQKLNKLKDKQEKVYLHYSQYGKINIILSLNKQILKTSSELISLYQILDNNTKILDHIIKEERYYISLLKRIKESLGST